MLRAAVVVWSFLQALSGGASLLAQEATGGPRFRVGLEGSYVPIYEGDVTVGPLSAYGVTARAGVWVTPRGRVDAFLTHAPGDDDLSTALPKLTYYGVLAGTSNLRLPGSGFSIFLEGGYGWMRVDHVPDLSGCRPPECFAEGGPGLREGTEGSVLLGAGAEAKLSEIMHARAGGRWHVSRPPSEAGLSLELGLGIQW